VLKSGAGVDLKAPDVAEARSSRAKGYAFGFVLIKDKAAAASYGPMVPPSLDKHGGKYVVKCPTEAAFSTKGDVKHMAYVIEFPSAADAKAWFEGPYQALLPTRDKFGDFTMYLAEGTGEHVMSGGPLGYALGTLTINDKSAAAEYGPLVPPTLEKHGGKYAVKCPKDMSIVATGDVKHMGFIMEFPSPAEAKAWFQGPYQELIPKRDKFADFNMIVCGGV